MDPLLGGVGGHRRQGSVKKERDKGVKRKQLTSSDSIKGNNKKSQLAYTLVAL